MPEAFYAQLDDSTFRPSAHTAGPWDARHQHGGPPSALLGRAMERLAGLADAITARVTVEILGPIPVDADLTVTAQSLRSGRSVELLSAELTANGRMVAAARCWRIRTGAIPVASPAGEPPALPAAGVDARVAGTIWDGHYLSAIEWRFAAGHFVDAGPATVWTRMRVPLLADEEPSPLQRVLTVADSGNGVSGELDPRRYLFINPELTVHLHRLPAGEWICLDARTTLQPHGVGLAETVIYDRAGRVGRGAQALLAAAR